MNDFIVLSEEPLLRVKTNVLLKSICDDLIKWANPQLTRGKVVDSLTGQEVENYEYRSASYAESKEYPPHYEHIVDTVSKITNLDKSRFETFTISHYKEGQEFKVHQDYFITPNDEFSKETEKRCEYGGNRVSTIILYLNDVEDGGETWFPCLDRQIIPKQGKLCQFNYDYDNWQSNFKTQHCSLPVIKGEKWIVTIWVRENSLEEKVTNFRRFTEESKIFDNVKDVSFTLNCGPDWDLRNFTITLPANTSPMNGIAVPVTGGMESSLLLYIISVLNSYQKIPYQIVPVSAVIWHDENGEPYIIENIPSVEKLIRYINQKIEYPKVRNIQYLVNDPSVTNDKLTVALEKVFSSPREFSYLKYVNFQYLFLGDTLIPTDESHNWSNRIFDRIKYEDKKWQQPFLHLLKYHIIDAIIKLDLLEIFENIEKCERNHKDLYEECDIFHCNERRWGFVKLDRKDLGDKYLIYKDYKNE